LDLSKVKLEQFQPEFLDIVRKNTTIDGKLYGLPYLWGTDGLVVNAKRTKVADYPDLCRADLRGKTAVRLKRPTLMAFAFAAGKDPFALYGDPKAYAALMDQVGAALIACKPMFKFFYDNKDQLLNGIRSGEVIAAMMWDTGGWTLNRENPDIQFVVPRSGALGWLDTFVLPARGKNRSLRMDQFHHATGKCCARHQVGGQLLRRQGHRLVGGSAPQSAVCRDLSQ
jgi:spermidine/putrescine transport system substrate-binding protein